MTNPVIDCLLNHRSIRKFAPRPIEPEMLDLILKAGTRAASAGNLQHYSLIVVDDEEKKKALMDSPMAENAIMVIVVVDEYRLKRWFELNGAPFHFDRIASLLVGLWDAEIVLQNVVIAAESLGLGTVFIGPSLEYDLRSILGAPEYVVPAGMVLIGHPDEAPELRPRLPLEAVVHRNRYQIPTDDDIRAFFQEKDQQWDDLPEDRRKELVARGIENAAQRVTVGHYTKEFIASRSQAILRNIENAGFKLTVE
jgi:nitroreductase